MAIVDVILTTTASGGYAAPNDFIGRIKSYLVLDPNVSIIRDNEATTVGTRELVYSVGGNSHHIKIYASSSTVYFQLLKLDGVTALDASKSVSASTSTYLRFRFLYNANTHLITLGLSPAENNPPIAFTFNVGDPKGWYIHASDFSSATGGYFGCYPADSDTRLYTSRMAYPYLEEGSKFVGIPRRYYSAGILTAYVHNYIWFSGAMLTGGLLTDSTGKQYICYSDGNYGILVKDP